MTTDEMRWPRRSGVDGWEAIRQPLYDTVEMYNGEPVPDHEPEEVRLNFFWAPLGTPQNSSGRMKMFLDTNMFLANQLPATQELLIDGIAVVFIPGKVNQKTLELGNNDWQQEVRDFYLNAVLELQIGSKNYALIPALELLPWYYSDMLAAVGVGSLAGLLTRLEDDHVVKYGRVFKLHPSDLRLVANQYFAVKIITPPLPNFKNDPFRKVRVILEGTLYRPLA